MVKELKVACMYSRISDCRTPVRDSGKLCKDPRLSGIINGCSQNQQPCRPQHSTPQHPKQTFKKPVLGNLSFDFLA